jgi:hypothetical protein
MEPLGRDEVRHDEEGDDEDDQARVVERLERSAQDHLP